MDEQQAPLSTAQPPNLIASPEDMRWVAALRAGDEAAFMKLVEMYHTALVRLAAMYVNDQTVAEEVAQETWIGVLRGLDRFEGRSSLKTWIFTILTNRAKTRAQRESRTLTFSDLVDDDEPAVSPDRFRPKEDTEWHDHWLVDPTYWNTLPEERLLNQETRQQIQSAIDALPANQREVITLRDIQGWSSAEVCNVLDISETNQRVLLHRARSKVRQALEHYFSQ